MQHNGHTIFCQRIVYIFVPCVDVTFGSIENRLYAAKAKDAPSNARDYRHWCCIYHCLRVRNLNYPYVNVYHLVTITLIKLVYITHGKHEVYATFNWKL